MGREPMSQETKDRISKTLTGRRLAPEHKAAIGRGLRGKPLPPKFVEGARAATIRRWQSPEGRAHMLAVHTGAKRSPESRQKMREAARQREANLEYRRRKLERMRSPAFRNRAREAKLGPRNPNWKGDSLTKNKSGHARARSVYAEWRGGPCKDCGQPSLDLHHSDGNPLNNAPHNILPLCRSCHMKRDGRFANLR